jgi:hypothetical protein
MTSNSTTRKTAAKKTAPADPNRHVLPSGGWVRLRNVDHLRARDVKTVSLDIEHRMKDVEGRVEAMTAVTDAFIALLVAEWDLPYEAADGVAWGVRPADNVALIADIRADDYNFLAVLLTPTITLVLPPQLGGTLTANP